MLAGLALHSAPICLERRLRPGLGVTASPPGWGPPGLASPAPCQSVAVWPRASQGPSRAVPRSGALPRPLSSPLRPHPAGFLAAHAEEKSSRRPEEAVRP